MKRFYDTELERLIRLHHSRLSEKEQRHYAAIEAQKLGHGGKRYIARLILLYHLKGSIEKESQYEEFCSDQATKTRQ